MPSWSSAAQLIEPFIRACMAELLHGADDAETENLRGQLAAVTCERETLTARIPQANAAAMRLINARAADLEQQEHGLRRALAAHAPSARESAWDALDFDGKRSVLDILLRRVTVSADEVRIFWRI